jgi:hypothetical protein
MSDQQLSDLQLGLKAAVRRAVKLAGGPVAAAQDTRADPARLSRYGNHLDPLVAPLDVAADLDRAAGDDVILRAWAAARGYALQMRGADATALDEMRKRGADLMRAALAVLDELNNADGSQSLPRLADEIAAGARAITDLDALVTGGGDTAEAQPQRVTAFRQR